MPELVGLSRGGDFKMKAMLTIIFYDILHTLSTTIYSEILEGTTMDRRNILMSSSALDAHIQPADRHTWKLLRME